MIKVGIAGATGYSGIGLIQILKSHPMVEIIWLSAESNAGKKLSDVRQSMYGVCDMICQPLEIEKLIPSVDVVFMGLPNGIAMKNAGAILSSGKKLIDISADFRIKDAKQFTDIYKMEHASAGLISQAVYGLSEINKDKIKKANLLSNPGCYPTASILGISPLLKNKMISDSSIIIDAKSGVSGAGASPSDKTHFDECNDNVRAYNVAAHRHNPEIDQELSAIAGKEIKTTFTPHLIPMDRGILSTIYADLNSDVSSAELFKQYREFYKDAPFVRILDEGKLPATKYVRGSNYCDISIVVDKRTKRVIVLSAIDNLVKGASGQAVQNMNIMFGLDETTGLEWAPVFP